MNPALKELEDRLLLAEQAAAGATPLELALETQRAFRFEDRAGIIFLDTYF